MLTAADLTVEKVEMALEATYEDLEVRYGDTGGFFSEEELNAVFLFYLVSGQPDLNMPC